MVREKRSATGLKSAVQDSELYGALQARDGADPRWSVCVLSSTTASPREGVGLQDPPLAVEARRDKDSAYHVYVAARGGGPQTRPRHTLHTTHDLSLIHI